ncbi:hypothetical protein [Chitinimonas lacunae]|uniref:Uncharacterized protein n=1 Tax=Chitinimonas lacunae TaxID=1963018 RepID=A0ABV8ML04_9NEIS
MSMWFLGAGIVALCVYFFSFISTVIHSLDKDEQRRFSQEGLPKGGFIKTLLLWVAFFYFKDPVASLLIGLLILADWWWEAKSRHRKLLALGFPAEFERRLWKVGYWLALGQVLLMIFVVIRQSSVPLT